MKFRTLSAASLVCLMALPTAAHAKFIAVAPGPNAQEKLQEALIEAESGDTVLLGTGKFELTDGLSLDVDGVTVRGSGMDSTVLSFANQQGAGEGLLVTSDGVTLTDFAVEDAKGDGIKAKGVDQISFKSVRVEWTGGPQTANGAYAIYPVESKNVLIEDSVAIGASDAGIYVGQSQNIMSCGATGPNETLLASRSRTAFMLMFTRTSRPTIPEAFWCLTFPT